MRVHYIKVEELPKDKALGRSTVGGAPILAANQPWPQCRLCKEQMILFFQFDLKEGFDLPLKTGSHLLVFMCPVHNDEPTDISGELDRKLPDDYWQKDYGHYAVILNRPLKDEQTLAPEERIVPRVIKFGKTLEEEIRWDGRVEVGTEGFKIGGVPAWLETPVSYDCFCGAEMILLCQVPEGFEFPRAKSAPIQKETPSRDSYLLMSGKQLYILTCKDQCSPRSLYVVAQQSAIEGEEIA